MPIILQVKGPRFTHASFAFSKFSNKNTIDAYDAYDDDGHVNIHEKSDFNDISKEQLRLLQLLCMPHSNTQSMSHGADPQYHSSAEESESEVS